MLRRAIVTVATGDSRHRPGPFSFRLGRWASGFLRHGEASLLAFKELPPGSPEHPDMPYAFKAHAIEAAGDAGFSQILWADSSVVAIRPLAPLWEHVSREGYWLSDNWEWGRGRWNCGQWACDAALPLLGITREEAFGIPQVAATAFALDLRSTIGSVFFVRFLGLAGNGSFRGPWENSHGEASPDPRVLGHRHDQTAASVIAHRMGLKLTSQPYFFSDCGHGETPDTLMRAER